MKCSIHNHHQWRAFSRIISLLLEQSQWCLQRLKEVPQSNIWGQIARLGGFQQTSAVETVQCLQSFGCGATWGCGSDHQHCQQCFEGADNQKLSSGWQRYFSHNTPSWNYVSIKTRCPTRAELVQLYGVIHNQFWDIIGECSSITIVTYANIKQETTTTIHL